MNQHNELLYETQDFDIACVLKYSSLDIVKTLNDRGKRIWCFQRSKRLDDVLAQYWQGKLTVDVVTFLATQRFMKSSLRNQSQHE